MRRHLIPIILFVLCLGPCAFAAPPVTLDDILKYKNITEVEVSPDGRRAAVVVAEADHDENTIRTNIHLVDSNGASFRLTNGPRHDEKLRWSPDGKWIAFISDRQAKPEKVGKKQVWLISPSGGEAWQLTRERFDVESLAWSPDGRRIAVVATEGLSEDQEKRRKEKDDALVVEQDLKFGRIYLVSVPEGNAELLYGSERHVSSISFSPKGDEIAFADQPTPKVPDQFNSVVRVVALPSKQVRVVAGGDTSNSGPKWSPDGRYLAFEGDSKSDWAANSFIYVAPAKGGSTQNVTRDMDERVLEFDWAEDSSSVYFSVARGLDRHIFRAMLDGKIITVNDREGVSRQLSVRKGTMAWVYETPSEPAEVYFAALRPKGRSSKFRFTPAKASSFNGWFKELTLGKTETITWVNKADGTRLEGLLLLPPGFTASKRYPLLLVIHGGPAGLFSRSFTLRRGVYPVQAFASQGYAVFMPNPRGSGGYGERFRKANLKDWGYGDYRDIQDGVDQLVSRGIADPDRMGVMGWSYGGYMTSWTITQTARFRAASVGAGVTNLFSMYGTTDIPPFLESYFGARPWEDRELMAKHSAMYFVDKVTTPTLIQHGTEDRRVPISQGEELFTALRARGVPSEMVQYPRSKHGIIEPKLIRDAMLRNLEWFDRYVKGDTKAAAWHKSPVTATAEKKE